MEVEYSMPMPNLESHRLLCCVPRVIVIHAFGGHNIYVCVNVCIWLMVSTSAKVSLLGITRAHTWTRNDRAIYDGCYD